MKEIGYWKCVTGAWHDGWDLTRKRPTLIVLSVAVLLIIDISRDKVLSAGLPPSFAVLVLGASWLLKSMAINAICVYLLRSLLLGEEEISVSMFFCREYWLYSLITWGTAALMTVAPMISAIFVAIVSRVGGTQGYAKGLAAICSFVARFIAVWLWMRLSMLPTRAAISGRLRWRTAWHETRGRSLGILGIYLAISFPILVAIALATIGAHLSDCCQQDSAKTLAQSLIMVPMLPVVCSGAAWVYRRYSADIRGD